METLNIVSTRKSPLALADIGLKDGDLITLSTLADEIGNTPELGVIPVRWIKSYVSKNLGREFDDVFETMFEEWKNNRKEKEWDITAI